MLCGLLTCSCYSSVSRIKEKPVDWVRDILFLTKLHACCPLYEQKERYISETMCMSVY